MPPRRLKLPGVSVRTTPATTVQVSPANAAQFVATCAAHSRHRDWAPAEYRVRQARLQCAPVLRGIPGATKVEEVSPPEDEEGAQGIQVFRLYAEDAGSLVIGATQAVMEAGAEIRDLHIARPSLEDVFIYLTGRNLRS